MICNACGTNLNDLNKKDKNKKIKDKTELTLDKKNYTKLIDKE